MKFTLAASAFIAALSSVSAQRPSNTSICDYYTSALLMSNTAENQYTLLKLLVNTVVIGNYTQPNMNAVPGILAPGTVNGTAVNLAPFFTGKSGPTTNRNGPVSGVNFLDGGGAVPLMNNTLPTAGSNEYILLTHLYEYFGYLLGCSMQGQTAFPNYGGNPSQYAVHRYMYLTYAQTTYFINQVALAAESFGVASADITVVGHALNSAFNVRCGPETAIPKSSPAELQSICVSSDCPLAANASCAAYAQNSTSGAAAGPNSTVVNAGNSGNGSSTSSSSGSKTSGSSSSGSSGTSGSKSDANTVAIGSFVGFAALVAALL